MNTGARRVLGFAPGLLYAAGLTVVGIVVAVSVGGSVASDSPAVRALTQAIAMALFVLVIVPAVLAWGGLIGSALGARWAFVLLMVPAIGHTALLAWLALVNQSPELFLGCGPVVLVTAVAAVTAPWMRPAARRAVR